MDPTGARRGFFARGERGEERDVEISWWLAIEDEKPRRAALCSARNWQMFTYASIALASCVAAVAVYRLQSRGSHCVRMLGGVVDRTSAESGCLQLLRGAQATVFLDKRDGNVVKRFHRDSKNQGIDARYDKEFRRESSVLKKAQGIEGLRVPKFISDDVDKREIRMEYLGKCSLLDVLSLDEECDGMLASFDFEDFVLAVSEFVRSFHRNVQMTYTDFKIENIVVQEVESGLDFFFVDFGLSQKFGTSEQPTGTFNSFPRSFEVPLFHNLKVAEDQVGEWKTVTYDQESDWESAFWMCFDVAAMLYTDEIGMVCPDDLHHLQKLAEKPKPISHAELDFEGFDYYLNKWALSRKYPEQLLKTDIWNAFQLPLRSP